MRIAIPADTNPYAEVTPYAVLGVPASASARELRDAQDRRLKETNEKYASDDKTRVAKITEIKEAYEAVCKSKKRLAIQVFVLDPKAGREECKSLAQTYEKVSYDYNRILGHSEQVFRTQPVLPRVEVVPEKSLVRSVQVCDDEKLRRPQPRTLALMGMRIEP
jgi:hypothetical protein